jgi:hypothetical protein
MWQAEGELLSAGTLGTLEPASVLFEYDGPCTFFCTSPSGELLLAHQCGEDGRTVRFVVVPITPDRVEELKAGAVDVHSVLSQPETVWLVDVAREWSVVAVRATTLAAIPNKYLPLPGTPLWPVGSSGNGVQTLNGQTEREAFGAGESGSRDTAMPP